MAKVKLGKPLPPVKDIPAPTEDEINVRVAEWNANCPPFYRGLMETQLLTDPNPTAKFLWDSVNLHYVHRKTGRVLTQREVLDAYIAFNNRITTR